MISRNKVRIQFIVVDIYVFTGLCIGTVKTDEWRQELLDTEFCEDIEELEEVEFVEVLSDDYEEDDIPLEEDITEDSIGEIISVSLT